LILRVSLEPVPMVELLGLTLKLRFDQAWRHRPRLSQPPLDQRRHLLQAASDELHLLLDQERVTPLSRSTTFVVAPANTW